MWVTFFLFKIFIEFITIMLLFFYVLFFFGHKAYRILAPWPGTEPASHVLEDKGLTTGPLGKVLCTVDV